MPLYAYEMSFKLEPGKDLLTLGCGIFITEKEITNDIIEMALSKLENSADQSPKLMQQDARILNRRSFHAAEVINNAR